MYPHDHLQDLGAIYKGRYNPLTLFFEGQLSYVDLCSCAYKALIQ